MAAKHQLSTQNSAHGGKKSSVANPKNAGPRQEGLLTRCIAYLKQVIALAKRVTWPDRRATFMTTIAVMAMVSITCIFFLIVDQAIGFGLHTLFQIGG